MKGTAHVVGAGLAGLCAAVRLAERGYRVILSEAAGQAGGRCRSYYDASVGCVIDNGNHLVLSGNGAVHSYLRLIGASGALSGPAHAEYAFWDLPSGRNWRFQPNESAFAWWVFSSHRRIPGTTLGDYLPYWRLMQAGPTSKIRDLVACKGPVWDGLLRPVLLSVLNTEPEEASGALVWAVIRETMLRGGAAYRPRVATPTLAQAFVEPALAYLQSRGCEVRFNRRLRRIGLGQGRIDGLDFAGGYEALGPNDPVVLAVPAWIADELLPGLKTPKAFRAIVNAHFRIVPPLGTPQILGVTGGLCEWIFAFPDRISVTISAADRLIETPRGDLSAKIWTEVAKITGLPSALPPWQIVKERRATFAATPDQVALRPATESATWHNLFLAGDWVDTGLPSTIEGALRSGAAAAAAAAYFEDHV